MTLTHRSHSLLIYPNPESALNEEAGKLLLEEYDSFARHAKLMTNIHARLRPSEFNPSLQIGTSTLPRPSTSSLKPVSKSREDSPAPLTPGLSLNAHPSTVSSMGLKEAYIRGLSPESTTSNHMPFPTLPLQDSAANNVNIVPGSPAPSSTAELPGVDHLMDDGLRSGSPKKRTVSSAMGKGSSAHIAAPQTKKATAKAAGGQKRGLRRL